MTEEVEYLPDKPFWKENPMKFYNRNTIIFSSPEMRLYIDRGPDYELGYISNAEEPYWLIRIYNVRCVGGSYGQYEIKFKDKDKLDKFIDEYLNSPEGEIIDLEKY